MKKVLQLLFLFLFFTKSVFTQTVPVNPTTNLYYLCKIWGYMKYFHTEVAKGTNNWDEILINNVYNVKYSQSEEDLTTALKTFMNFAGPMKSSTNTLPEVPAELRYNLNLDWIESNYLPIEIKAQLTEVKTLFRPQNNYYISSDMGIGNPILNNDIKYYNSKFQNDETVRLLSLFRYWNIINYFYPHKNIIDNNWDEILLEFIPKFSNAVNETLYGYTMLELAARINDSHAATGSETIYNFYGDYYLPLKLKFINGQTTIYKVGKDITVCKPGDIIKKMNGRDIGIIRDSLKKYTPGSNEQSLQKSVCQWLVLQKRNDAPVKLEIENESGIKEISLNTFDYLQYSSLFSANKVSWKIINKEGKPFGYIDLGNLTTDQVPSMFNELWHCYALIFDVRNRPKSTIYSIIPYLFPASVIGVHYLIPNLNYPGTFGWFTQQYIGQGDFSKNYTKRIYILFNEETLSHAEFTVMCLEQHPKAIKIGSQTAGADGNVSIIYLPYGITTYFTGLGVFYPDNRPTQRVGIIPDIEVKPTIQGIREGMDEVLEAAFTHFLTTAVEEPDILPRNYSLSQNYPNPFNPTTTIKYSIPSVETLHTTSLQRITLKIYDTLGREITTLVDEIKQPGTYSVKFNAGSLPSGAYFYQIKAGNYRDTKKLMLLK